MSMASHVQDNSQWLSVTEETLFLHDGLLRVTDLVELPRDVNTVNELDREVISFDSKSPFELSDKLKTVCGTHNNAYTRLLEYRLNALKGLWNAQKQISLGEQSERNESTHEETIALLKKQGLWKEVEQASFSTRVSLLLVLPLLHSQSKFDPSLCGVTAELLLTCLRDCPPLSLTKEPADCLNGLENLLCGWLGELRDTTLPKLKGVGDPAQKVNAASALIALACARGHLKTFIHTIHLLQNLSELGPLPVSNVLHKLLEMEGGQGQPSSVLGSKHIVCWGLEDMLGAIDKEGERDKDAVELGRSVCCDGRFLYTTNSIGKGIAKIGTGLHGTLRGCIYAKNSDLDTGWIAWGNNCLLYRKMRNDSDKDAYNTLGEILDPHTLMPIGIIKKPAQYCSVSQPVTTITLTSDGLYFYWIWCSGSPMDKNAKGQQVFLEQMKIESDNMTATALKPSTLLQKKDESLSKNINETLLSRLRPYRSAASAHAPLVALATGDPLPGRKEDTNVATSIGTALKTLLHTPVYCDGSTVVFLNPVPGGNNSNAARSLFGSGGTVGTLRSLGTNVCFKVSDGQFIARTDVIDAPTCGLARGASVLGLGLCYDPRNNMIWSCCNDWVDQFYNPGHQAPHHVLARLGFDAENITEPEDIPLEPVKVVEQILQHVGCMCIHQINNDLLHTPLGSYILQQHPVDLVYMERVCDILEKALGDGDLRIIKCILIVFQLMFKLNVFKRERDKEVQLVNRTSKLVWQVVNTPSTDGSCSSLQAEAATLISYGLKVFYPTMEERNNLLFKLLTEDSSNPGLEYLRDLVLVDYGDQLRNQVLETESVIHSRLTAELVQLILKYAIQDSCKLLRKCKTTDKKEFDQILASVPMSSPCLQYLMALQSHLLRAAVLYKESADDEQAASTEKLESLQSSILSLASMVCNGGYEVLEVLLETCNAVINSEQYDDLELRLQGIERVTKATILGHLLPVLVTAMNHYNLRWLPMADTLMSQLVQLVVLTSQAALLLKSQVQVIKQEEEAGDTESESDVLDLLGESFNLEGTEIEDQEEQGFLAGLKIPAPWATGKTIETIHPVRDNYKFKETVHIPGARCLYLRFDPRCSSQYDYDKVVIYAGATTSSRKVAEYGGNTYGFGSRSVLGSGWPKDLVKVEGDTVTISFEMRSGREHNTPDKAMWGFLVTVRAQEPAEEVSSGLPFLADLALGLCVLGCTMLHLLYQGPTKTKDEVACEHLLKSKLLQRCVWQTDPVKALPQSPSRIRSRIEIVIEEDIELQLAEAAEDTSKQDLARIKLPTEIMQKLRELSGKVAPQLRPSIREVLQPSVLEEKIVSATLKHLSLMDAVRHLSSLQEQQNDDYWLLTSVMSELFKKIDALIRQLQTLAELEQKWTVEVQELRQDFQKPEAVFFSDYHLYEVKTKELALLCFLKDVDMDLNELDNVVTTLRQKLEAEAHQEKDDQSSEQTPKTKSLVSGLLERLDLLLQVNIAPAAGQGGHLHRSVSQYHEGLMQPFPSAMVRSDTDVFKTSPPYSRSLSAPSEVHGVLDDSVLDIMRLQRKRQAAKKGPASVLQDLVEEGPQDIPPYVKLIEQLFTFIGSNPERAVSCESFLSAAKVRCKRGQTRKRALIHMKELLTAASKVGGATHLVAAVTSVLQHGPRVDELTCGGMVDQVREAFAETMTSVVQLSARFPIACSNSIGLLCIIPYTRAEEKCLVRCGLVHLLDKLCSLSNYRGDTANSDTQSTRQRVSAMAWAGFQVLANRCVMWEQDEVTQVDELEHSGLARQVSFLLTNHLARATEGNGNEAAGNEALQEVLSLLNTLSRSRMGKDILIQPACVSKLLSLLLDQRPSPKLVLVILQLCRVALPLMSAADCAKVELPTWSQHLHTDMADSELTDPCSRIASLLLAKLGDFIVPGTQVTTFNQPSVDGSQGGISGGEKDKNDDQDVQDGRLSVFVHKREDQSSHEVIQPLLSSDSRPFRLGGGANMERVVRMDWEMAKTGKAEITTEDAVSALRKAAKWAQLGFIVSTGPPTEGTVVKETTTGDKKKLATDVICKDRNAELARTDPVRPFISGHVANSMAAEVIALLHSLLTAPESNTAQVWGNAVQKVLSAALTGLPVLIGAMDRFGSPRFHPQEMMCMAKEANAALCALGGFKETVKPMCEVEIKGEGLSNSFGTVTSVSEESGVASVNLPSQDDCEVVTPRYSDTVQVPVKRLMPPRNEPLPLHQLSMTESIVAAIQALLLPQNGSGSPLSQPLPQTGDGSTLNNQLARVVAEIRTRACMVLAKNLCDITFTSAFIQHSSAAIDILKSLSKDGSTAERVDVVEAKCEKLRMLYRDCAKPPPPPAKTENRVNKEIHWDTGRGFPAVRSCLFSHGLTGITFVGDPSAGSGLPRGVLVYSNLPVPNQAPSFYWEIEICSLGNPQEESGPFISFGFAPAAEKKEGAWTNPVGTCLFHNNGRAVHYNGSSLLQWRSIRLDCGLNSGDIAGCGWERSDENPPISGQQAKGYVYFTYNGQRMQATLDDVAGGMWPVVHIQKKNTQIKANFGAKPFAYAEGKNHQAHPSDHDLTREIRESFAALPFHMASDSDGEGHSSTASISTDHTDLSQPGPPCRLGSAPRASNEYNSEACVNFKLLPSYDNFITTGPDTRTQLSNQDEESDIDDSPDDQPSEDHYALVVKAWEQKVFPTIRRRFRNEAERKDGLEQIRGALQLGMTDIARQTVEFLYEENGGMPRDLHLPTIEDIKEELAKFSIERVHRGTSVVIMNPGSGTSGSILPKFAVRGMLKTFGLTGVVTDVDQSNELVQVETYLRSEGVLVRYWYPISMLERPPQGFRRTTFMGQRPVDTSSILIHRELLRWESCLARMYCRTALLELINQCNSPAMETLSCSTSLSSGMAASAALLQELDVENLQLLSNELLMPPQPHGCIIASSLLTSMSPRQCLAPNMCSMSQIFYQDRDRILEELKVAISRAANQGEDYVIELSNQICVCLQIAPEMFQVEEFPVTEMKINTDVYFPGAAFLVISCKADPKAAKKDTSLYKSPWARIFTYTGNRIKKTGQCTKQEVVCYPRDTTSNSNASDQYSAVIVSADRVHVRVGVSPPPGIILTIHALPPQYPLAMAYIETLVSQKMMGILGQVPSAGIAEEVPSCGESKVKDDGSGRRNFESVAITPTPLRHIIELMGGYLWRTDVPAILKENSFHLLAQVLRVWQISHDDITEAILPVGLHASPSLSLLYQVQSELRRLYEEETKSWPSSSTSSGVGIGLGVGDTGRFSTYFHSLLEVSLAIAEVSSPQLCSGLLATGPSSPKMVTETPPPASPVTSKRKKLKAKRERDRASSRRSTSPKTNEAECGITVTASSPTSTPAGNTSDSAYSSGSKSGTPSSSSVSGVSASSSGSSVSISSAKPEEMLWFHRALTMSQILRHLTYGDKQGESVTNDAVSDAYQTLVAPTAHTRLMVISGIPSTMEPEEVEKAILKVCSANGGIYKGEFFLPVQDVKLKAEKVLSAAQSKTTFEGSTQKKNVAVTEMPSPDVKQKDSFSKNVPSLPLSDAPNLKKKKVIKGYAVIELRSKNKLDSVRKALFKCKQLIAGMTFDPDELADMSDEMFSISPVNQTLFADPQGNDALEDFLHHKILTDAGDLNDDAMLVLTDIFHSCYITEQRRGFPESWSESGYICLSRDQIMSQSSGNLCYSFFSNVRAAKKTFSEQVSYVLRKYGMLKVEDKDEPSPPEKSGGKGKAGKKGGKMSKEKMAMGASGQTKVSPREKKKKEAASDKEKVDSAVKPTKEKEEEKLLTLNGFLQFVIEKAKQDARSVWKALLACGYDLHFDRCSCIDTTQAQQMSKEWTLDMDCALVKHINTLCRHLAISPSRLHPHEVYLTEAELSSANYSCLQGVPIESLRLRFALLQSLNNSLETFFLPLIDLRPSKMFTRSTAALLSQARGLVFYDTKTVFLNRVLNATAQRKPDQAAPEITLDPLENVGAEKKGIPQFNLCQAYRQLSNIPSSQLCVQIAAGGDPTYSFNVKMTGEEVHGTSGSFRHFLWQVARELEMPCLDMLMLCPSAAGSRNKGKYILIPGDTTYPGEKLLEFLGQLLGITIRADIPIGLDLLPVFWKTLVDAPLDPVTDLQEADLLTYNYIKQFEMVENHAELQALCAESYPRFMYNTLTGEQVELVPNGRNTFVNWENRHQYVEAIKELRAEELACKARMSALKAGLASIIPVQLLSIMTPLDMEHRTCGIPQVDLEFLKAHTMYQVGLMETDQHIEYFWAALESFSQEELCKFIKFACNQERIPQTCPCRDGGTDTAHVPPYPMKMVAPPDGQQGNPDTRHIRVETCLFMIKLPQYTSYEIMREKLLYAIHCRDDPLSG